jgi:flagellar basal body P-ring formation protein FlgA
MKRTLVLVTLLVAALAAGQVQAADLDQAIRTRVSELYQLDPEWYHIDILANHLKVTQLADNQELTFKPLSQKEPLGLFSLNAIISENGKEISSGQVSLNIHKMAEVLTATDLLQRHDIPGPDNVTVQKVDITNLQEQPVTSLDMTSGYRLKRNISKGQIITRNAMEPIPDIEVGGDVTIVCNEGLLQVSVPGQALEAGLTGSVVRVRNNASRKILTARVVDAKTVAVEP